MSSGVRREFEKWISRHKHQISFLKGQHAKDKVHFLIACRDKSWKSPVKKKYSKKLHYYSRADVDKCYLTVCYVVTSGTRLCVIKQNRNSISSVDRLSMYHAGSE